jgi:hypothetical protein
MTRKEAFAAVSVTLPPFEPERHVAAFREAMDRAERKIRQVEGFAQDQSRAAVAAPHFKNPFAFSQSIVARRTM